MKTPSTQAIVAASIAALLVYGVPACAEIPTALQDIRFDQRLNEPVPLELTFKDESGRRVRLADYFGRRPVILVLAYYQCPRLCTLVLNGLVQGMLEMPLVAGKDFEVVTVSFDPRETPDLAASKKESYLQRYGRPGAADGWHFLTGEESQIRQLADAVGFHYRFDPAKNQYMHASGIMILTPEGRLSRYFYDVKYSGRDLRLGLVEASQNRIGSAVEQILLYCFHYDPTLGKYSASVMNFVRAGGAFTMIAIGLFLWRLSKTAPEGGFSWFAASSTVATCRKRAAMNEQISILPGAASTTAASVDRISILLFIVCFAVGTLVAVLLIGFSVYYRRRPGNDATPPATHPSHLLEWFWTLTPMVIFVGFFAWGGTIYLSAFSPPADALPLYVVGKQWMWKFQHPEGQREIATLHVPVGRPVQLVMISEDVIHSFFVPAFRLHMDVLPQRYTSAWFQATKPGTYHLFCSQYCGTNHAGMVGKVVVLEPAEYQEWLTYSAEGSLALQGRQAVLKYRCLSCHGANATARAPSLEELFGSRVPLRDGGVATADDNYIREWIRPGAKIVAGHMDIMPSFAGQVSEEEVIAIIAYLRSLARGETPPRVEDFPAPTTTPPINSTESQL